MPDQVSELMKENNLLKEKLIKQMELNVELLKKLIEIEENPKIDYIPIYPYQPYKPWEPGKTTGDPPPNIITTTGTPVSKTTKDKYLSYVKIALENFGEK